MANIEGDTVVSKDSILELAALFYEDNSRFLELFEKAFLLVFQTYTALDGRVYRNCTK